MKGQESILGRLMRSLGVVALLGSLLLLIVIGIEYRLSFAHLSNAVALKQALHELAEHVLLPMLLLATPMAFAGRWAIKQAVKPLEVAANRINAGKDEARGLRIDALKLPVETVPFAHAINSLLDRVDRAATMHEAFAADIAHELRTPLTLLSLQLDQLDDPKVEAMRADIAAMRRLIEQLMLLAQIDAEEAAHLPPADIDLVEIAGDVIAQMAPAALSEGKLLELRGAQAGCIEGRREAVTAALRNLVENALRVTPQGVPVVIFADRPGELAVRDGGPGLSTEHLHTLTQRLRRADHASQNGAGLGLSIVARIMAAHGGTLSTEPELHELRLLFKKS